MERNAVLKAVCAGFKETTEPPICLSGGFYTDNEFKMMMTVMIIWKLMGLKCLINRFRDKPVP